MHTKIPGLKKELSEATLEKTMMELMSLSGSSTEKLCIKPTQVAIVRPDLLTPRQVRYLQKLGVVINGRD